MAANDVTSTVSNATVDSMVNGYSRNLEIIPNNLDDGRKTCNNGISNELVKQSNACGTLHYPATEDKPSNIAMVQKIVEAITNDCFVEIERKASKTDHNKKVSAKSTKMVSIHPGKLLCIRVLISIIIFKLRIFG